MVRVVFESLESRTLLTAAQDITSLTALRQDPLFAGINGSGIGVAVLDSGTFANHPDLRGNFVAFFDAVRSPASSGGSTRVTDAFDPDGHGTHTAGTAVSTNPEIGVATGARLVAVRALPADNEAQPSFDTVANGLQWVLNNVTRFNIKVVNLSLGVPTINDNTGRLSDQESQLIRRLENQGVTVVAAAGNNYADFAPQRGAATPAAYSTLVVSNTWADTGRPGDFPIIAGSGGNVRFFAQENDAAPDRFAATSQRSTLPGQIAAPGSAILSTWNDPNKLYQFDSGTSMAAPFVSGTVALMQQASFVLSGRYLTPDQVRTVLVTSSDTIVDATVTTNSRIPVRFDASGNPSRAGANQDLPETGLSFKRVNAHAALRAVRSLVTTGDATPPATPTPPPAGTDPDATTATATVVTPLDGSQTYDFAGAIGTDGTVNVGGTDVDLYRLSVLSPGVLSAALTQPSGATAFAATLRLFDAAGSPVQVQTSSSPGSYPTLVSSRLAPGTYYLGVSGTGNSTYAVTTRTGAVSTAQTGGYALNVGLANPDPNGVPQGAFSIDLLAPNSTDPRSNAAATRIAGTIGSDPNPLDEGGPRVQIGATDIDMFRVVAPDDGVLTINTLGAGSDVHLFDGVSTFLRAFDADFNPVGIDLRFTGFGSADAIASFVVTRGAVYYVGVGSSGNTDYDAASSFDRSSTTGQTGSYDAYFAFDNGDRDGTAYDAPLQSVGTDLPGIIGADAGLTLPGNPAGTKDVDFYRYTVPASGLIDLEASPTADGYMPVLALWRLSADRTAITRDADTTGRAARIVAPASAGETIYVSVTAPGNDDFLWFAQASGSGGSGGAYTLRSQMRPASDLKTLTNSSIRLGTPTEVVANQPVYANLGTTNAVETGPASVNLYRFVATYTGPLSVRASVPTDQPTDPFLRIFDALGAELAFNDDASASTRDAQLTLEVVAGRTYFIGVNPSSSGARNYSPLTGDGAVAGTEGDYVLLLSVPPRLTLTATEVVQSAGVSGSAVFTLSLPEPARQAVTATFSTFDAGGYHGARAGADYQAVTQSLTIAPGQTSVSVTVPVTTSLAPGRTAVIGGLLTGITNARRGTVTAFATVSPADPTPAAPTTPGADLAAESLAVRFAGSPAESPITPGDRMSATLVLRAADVARLAGRFSLRTVISSDPLVTGNDIRFAADRTLTLRLTPGRSNTQRFTATVPSGLEPGTYFAVTTLTPLGSAPDAQPLNNLVVSAPFTVEWRLGTFTGHRGKTLSLPTSEGTNLTFSLTGPGSGTVTRDSDSGLLSITLAATTRTTALTITPARSGTTARLLNLTAESPLRAILASRVAVLGDLTLSTPAPPIVRLLGR